METSNELVGDSMETPKTSRLAQYIAHKKAVYQTTVLENPFIPHVPFLRQAELLECDVVEVLYGGSAGGGKSDALLMAALQYVEVPGYNALILRRTFSDLSQPDAIMDRAQKWLMPYVDAGLVRWDAQRHRFTFPSGATLTFGYLMHENDKYQYQCFHPETEILTFDGWKPIADVVVGEYVASMDPTTRVMQYKPVSATWRYHYKGDLIYVNQRQGSAFAVTPNHTIWASTQRVKRLRPYRADSLPLVAAIPQWAYWIGTKPPEHITFNSDGHNGRSITFTSKQWMSFLGWYISEGNCWRSTWGIKITQINSAGQELIEALLKDVGINYHKSAQGFTFNNKALYTYLKKLGTSNEKHIPPEVMEYSPEYLQLLLDTLIEGDGTWYDCEHNSGRFVTSSTKLADDVSEIAIKAGYRATLNLVQGNDSSSEFGTKPRWHVSIFRVAKSINRDTAVCGSSHGVYLRPKRIPYEGPVYCVTVPPFHTVLIRFRGKISWSGQSAQFQFIGIDELTQFTFKTYSYMWSRLRKLAGVDIPLRFWCGSNPGGRGHEWVRAYFVKTTRKDRMYIPSRLTDNPYLDQKTYLENLKRLSIVEQLQLIHGDWDVRVEGDLFKGSWFENNLVDPADVPQDARVVRCWDKAATPVSEECPDPDWTRGVKMAEKDGIYYVMDLKSIRGTPGDVDALMEATAKEDGYEVEIYEEQEPGSSGKSEVYHHSVTIFKGYMHSGIPSSGDKITRAKPMSSAAQQGRIKLVRGAWNSEWIDEVKAFPQEGVHDDIVDASSLCFSVLSESVETQIDYGNISVEDAFGGAMA